MAEKTPKIKLGRRNYKKIGSKNLVQSHKRAAELFIQNYADLEDLIELKELTNQKEDDLMKE